MAKEEVKNVNLFDYTEEQLLEECVLTHYEILGLSPYGSTQDDVKKSFRKKSLKYHPDKHDGQDYAFLALRKAHDELYDPEKRQAYDSTKLPFDDSVPPPRDKLLQDTMLMYKDGDFYGLYGPVFQRNLRFDARLRPEKNKRKIKPAPVLGDSDTPLSEVHAFYEYWIHFDSWRDFTQQATDELNLENEVENAESRFEKRWLQKEIQKKAKQYKRKEVARVQSLVERAMEADPRLRQERADQLKAKEDAKKAKQERAEEAKRNAQREVEEQARMEREQEAQRAKDKLEREEQKKLLRKARQSLRKTSTTMFKENEYWADSYDMGLAVDLLCQSLEETALHELVQNMKSDSGDALRILHSRAEDVKNNQQEAEASTAPSSASPEKNQTKSTQKPWTKEELSALAKAVKKYPPGGASRWEQIALFVNNLCKLPDPRSKEACIEKYNNIAKSKTKETAQPGAVSNKTDAWTADQDQQLQDGLSSNPASMDKNERWTAIAKGVTGKSKKQCVARFKEIREALKKK